MPIYEYVCLDCGERFEAIRSMSEADTPIPCSGCMSDHTSRQLAVVFARGGGSSSSAPERYTPSRSSGCGGCSGGSCATCH